MQHYPNLNQIVALKQFARLNGRTWKAALRDAWMTSHYDRYGIDQYGDTAAYLQQVRNTFGPSWLTGFMLCEDGSWYVLAKEK
jgi:hypothetical protein